MRRSMKHILLGAVMATILFCSLGFYDQDYHVNQGIYYDDDCDVFFGTDLDFSIYSDTANILEFDPLTAGNEIRFGTAFGDAVDITWYGDLTGDTVTFDEENCEVLFTDIDLQLDDAAKLIIGTGDDFAVYSDTADTLEFDPTTAGAEIRLGTSATDAVDVNWFGDTAGDTVLFDEENCEVLFTDIDLQLDDSALLIFGTGDDFTVYSDTANTLEFDPGTAGNEIKFGTSDTDTVKITWYADVSGDTITFDEENVQLDLLDVDLNVQGGAKLEGALYHVSRKIENHSSSHELTSPTDIGTLITVDTAAVVITLPDVAAGATYTIMNIGADGTEIHVDPNSNDLIAGGCGFAAALNDGDKLTNTAGTAHYGDYVTVTYFDATGWYIIDMVGTWADGS